jgi:hypothetical protein
VVRITKRHRNYVPLNWLYGYAGYLLDGKDNFFEISHPSLIKYALTLAMGARYNPTQFHKFLAEAARNSGLALRMLWNQWRGRYPAAPANR